MKKNLFSLFPSLELLIALALGIGATTQAAPVASVEKTSFTEVTSQLDPGGDFYLYLGTAQWMADLSGKVATWQDKIAAMPDMKPEDLDNVYNAFNIATNLIKDSGIEDVTGVGMSSIEIEKGLYRNKMLLHHYPGKGTGFMWKFMGQGPHPLTGLDLCPSNTALACFYDANFPLAWSTIQREVNNSNFPQAKDWLKQLPDQFEDKAGMKWDQFMHSLGNDYGLVLTLDPSNNIPVPVGSSALMIPAPELMLVLKINDDAIFNRIDEQLKTNPMVISVDKTDLKMRTMPIPLPLPIELRPTVASSGGYLLVSSSDDMINEALAVKSGKAPGLKDTDEFKHLSQNIPDQANGLVFMGRRFGETLTDIQKQTLANGAKNGAAQSQWLQSLFQRSPAYAYSVTMVTPDGCVAVGNASQSYTSLILLPAVAMPAMLASIAVPNFVKARSTSQENACINNLRQIDAAKNEWALEKNKTASDTPTWDDLKPYLSGTVPLTCPAGGSYTLNAVGQPPTCSIPGHALRQ